MRRLTRGKFLQAHLQLVGKGHFSPFDKGVADYSYVAVLRGTRGIDRLAVQKSQTLAL